MTGISKESMTENTPSPVIDPSVSMTTAELDVMKEFEDTMNDIMVQGTFCVYNLRYCCSGPA